MRSTTLNGKIVSLAAQGVDVSGLQDERSRLIDAIATIVPVRVVKRDGDQVALYSANGGVLLDGRVFELGFTPAANVVTPDLTLGAGLDGLTQDQGAAGGPVAVAAGTGSGLFDGGSLGALFEVRDRIVPEFDAEIDRYANDLIERFRDLMPAAALDASGEGLFVDGNPGAADRARRADRDQRRGRPGRAGRRGLAAARRALGGGARDRGQRRRSCRRWPTRWSRRATPIGFVSQNAQVGSATMASEIGSFFAGRSARSDEDRAYLTARQSTLAEQESHATGVDTDAELEVADAGRADLCRERPGALGDRRADEAAAGGLSPCA